MHLAVHNHRTLLSGQGVGGSVEQRSHVDSSSGADDVRVVGRRTDADCLGGPPEQVAHMVHELLQNVSRPEAHAVSEDLVKEDNVSCGLGSSWRAVC